MRRVRAWRNRVATRFVDEIDDRESTGDPEARLHDLPLVQGATGPASRHLGRLDNLSTHKTKGVRESLAEHPNVHLHFTPTYSSWLNQVENWFARIERNVIARGVFNSVRDLARKLMRYIRHHNRAAKPIQWAYRDPSHRILPTFDSVVTGH